MMKLFPATLLALAIATPLVAEEPIHLGQFQEVRTREVTYDAFVPTRFHPTARWPFILVVGDDPRSIARFQAAAEKYGYVVAQSRSAAARNAWNDARKRFHANASRSYVILAGRGAARVNLAELGDVSGLAAINVVPANLDAPTLFFAFGNLDTSYIELKQLSRMTSEQRRRVGSETFDGTELTAEVATRIVEWFHLDALDQGIAVVTDDHLAGIVSSWTAAAHALEAAEPLRAVAMYNAIVANFSAVTAQARTRATEVASTLAYSRAEFAESRAVRWEAAQKKRILTSAKIGTNANAYLESIDIDGVQKKISGKDGAMKDAAVRVVRYALEIANEQQSAGARREFWQSVATQLRSMDVPAESGD